MILKSSTSSIYAVLLVGLITSLFAQHKAEACTGPSYASYAPYMIPIAVAAVGGAISFGWHWWTMSTMNNKVHLVAVDVEQARKDVHAVDERVQNVQKIQAEQTEGISKLQTSSDKNFKAVSSDISALKNMTEKGLQELSAGQKEIIQNVDAVRGLLDRKFDGQARELAELKAMVEQLRAHAPQVGGKSVASVREAAVAQEKTSGSYVHRPLFPALAQ
jgi:hypothetical protein